MMICLYGILAAAVIEDFRSFRIPNTLILIGLAAGMILRGFNDKGPPGIIEGLISGAAIIFILFPLYLIKAIGAGDIKLFSVIAVFILLKDTVQIFLLSLFIGSVLGVLSSLFTELFMSKVLKIKYSQEKWQNNNFICFVTGRCSCLLKNFGFYNGALWINNFGKKLKLHRIHFSLPVLLSVLIFMEVLS